MRIKGLLCFTKGAFDHGSCRPPFSYVYVALNSCGYQLFAYMRIDTRRSAVAFSHTVHSNMLVEASVPRGRTVGCTLLALGKGYVSPRG